MYRLHNNHEKSGNKPAPHRLLKIRRTLFLFLLVICFVPLWSCHVQKNTVDKLTAAHLSCRVWAPDFWSYLNLDDVGPELEVFKADGFNTVIIVVPWTGFQTSVFPIEYHQEYLNLFDRLLETVRSHQLKVILRIGYAHDKGPASTPSHIDRLVGLAEGNHTLDAWVDFLDQIWKIAHKYDNVLFGFISWEDFFYLGFSYLPYDQRLALASRIGYQKYLQESPLGHLSSLSGETYTTYSQIPIPQVNTNVIPLYLAFWDDLLINRIFKISRAHFPTLSVEVRIDCDPAEQSSRFICHEDTFDLLPGTDLSVVYYSPAWGALNRADKNDAKEALRLLKAMLGEVREHTTNRLFMDQFNFIDNTPGFENNTIIAPEELALFLEKAAPILDKYTIGYGLWSIRDLAANALRNGSFERDYPSWDLKNATIGNTQDNKRKCLILKPNGLAGQTFSYEGLFVQPKSGPLLFTFDFEAMATRDVDAILSIKVLAPNGEMVSRREMAVKPSKWRKYSLASVPFNFGYRVELSSGESEILLDDLYLYSYFQECGIYDSQDKPKLFYESIKALNRRLAGLASEEPKIYFTADQIEKGQFEGVYPDLWVGKSFSGEIDLPDSTLPHRFVVKAYVPEQWKGYENSGSLVLDGKSCGSKKIMLGYNELSFDLSPNKTERKTVPFNFTLDSVFSPQEFQADTSSDKRMISFKVVEFGFVSAQRGPASPRGK